MVSSYESVDVNDCKNNFKSTFLGSYSKQKTSVSFDRGQRMTHRLVSDSGSMDDNDPFGERVFNERETVSCHDTNPAFDNLQ